MTRRQEIVLEKRNQKLLADIKFVFASKKFDEKCNCKICRLVRKSLESDLDVKVN